MFVRVCGISRGMIIRIRVLTIGGVVVRGVVRRIHATRIVYDTISINLGLPRVRSNIPEFSTTQWNPVGQPVSPAYPVPPHCP